MTSACTTTRPTQALSIEGLTVNYSGLLALDTIDLTMGTGRVLGLVGPNGSGKTTLFNAISGFVAPSSGKIWWGGSEIQGLAPHRVARMGICRTFQEATTFQDYTVTENLRVAALANPSSDNTMHDVEMSELISLCGLEAYRASRSHDLPYGAQRRLGVGLAVATDPSLLLLDEPAAGLGGPEVAELAELIVSLAQRGMSITVIDHNLGFLFPICEEVAVLNSGHVIVIDTPSAVLNNPEVIEVYLGEEVE